MNESFSYNSIKMLTGKLIGLAKACQTKPKTDNTDRIILYVLTELGHADFLADDNEKIKLLEDIIEGEKRKIVPDCAYCANPCGNTSPYDMNALETCPGDIKDMKLKLLERIIDLSKKAYQMVKKNDLAENISIIFYKVLCVVSYDFSLEELEDIMKEVEDISNFLSD